MGGGKYRRRIRILLLWVSAFFSNPIPIHSLFSRDPHSHTLLYKYMVCAIYAVSSSLYASRLIRPISSSCYRISSRISFDNTGAPYDVRKIINPDSRVNVEGYKVYSPLFLSTTFAMAYGLSFAAITATVTHTFLYFRKQIWIQARRSLNEQPDIHARLMARYAQVPEWWYGVVFGECWAI